MHRCDPARRFDRFDDPVEIPRFAAAASVFRQEEVGRPLAVANAEAIAARRAGFEGIGRCAVSRRCAGKRVDASTLAAFLRACAAALDGREELSASADAPFGEAGVPLPFETALAVSALSLLNGASLKKLKVCPNCNWLFLDRSRNSSRLWCDMAVCGNRAKARHHYRRQRLRREKTDG